jgi:hypothetical protein
MTWLNVGLAVLISSLGVVDNQPGTEAEADREAKKQVYQLTERLLEGKPLIVRVYADPVNHPEAFRQVTVPIRMCRVSPDAIRSAFGLIPDKAPLVALGRDQSHEAVAAVLGDYVFARAYRPQGESLYLYPPFFDDPGHEWWVFLDALGQPVREASVEIGLYEATSDVRVILDKGRLDAQGRLKRIREGYLYGKLIFTVSHPNYGTATTEYTSLPAIKDAPETYVVPLVPLDSPAAAGACRGTVTDSQGKPVASVTISCEGLTSPPGERLNVFGGRFMGTAITNEQGRFAGYWPIFKEGAPSDDLVPAGSLYMVRIEPNKSLNLRQYEGSLVAGADATIALSAMQADEFLHTFTFEGQAGPITDPEELKRVILTLYRDQRPWRELTYDQWKNGCSLPAGTLRATTRREGYSFTFEPVTLSADSRQEIVIKESNAITYRGQVVDDATGEPMPNVLVGVGSLYARWDPCSFTPRQWQDMRNQAAEQASAGFPSRIYYQSEYRLTVTDANGEYEVVFLPGSSRSLSAFVAMQPGYALSSTSIPNYINPDEDGIIQVPTLRLSPPATAAPSYFPTFVFEDENGPVTDPNKLKSVRLEINHVGGRWQLSPLDYIQERRTFTAGTYRATATWQGKYYVFESVDLSEDRPETVVFKPREILTADITYQGQVVHGITGRPISQALVMNREDGMGFDASGLTAEQWKAIKAMGPDLDPANPVLAPLMQAIADSHGMPAPRCALTDAQGRFRIAVNREHTNFGRLAILDKDFLCTEQQLVKRMRPTGDPEQPTAPAMLGAEVNGRVTLPPIKLFPAGTVLLEPVPPENAYSDFQKPRLTLFVVTAKDDPTPWRSDLWASPVDNAGASVSRRKDLRPNVPQSLYVPANVSMALLLYDPTASRYAPLVIPDVAVKQGQVLDLGLTATIKVVDSAGNPVEALRLYCMDDRYGHCGVTAPTNRYGTAEARVVLSTKGKFVAYCFGRSTQDRLEASVAYEIAGLEDNGREFVLQLPEAFVERLREASHKRQMEAMPIQPPPAARYPGGSRRR